MKKKIEKKSDYLIVGLKEDNKETISLSHDALLLNTSIIGVKGSRKSSYILPTLARQTMSLGEEVGSTYFITGINDGDLLYAIAKRLRKKNPIVYIKPSRDAVVYDELINNKEYNYKRYNEFLNVANMIRTKSFVIIDAEEYKYGDLSKKFIEKILNHFYLSMQDVKTTLNREHILFFDEADQYIKQLNSILKYGDTFNISSILFLESRHYLSEEDKRTLDIYIRNKIILTNLVKEDKIFYDLNQLSYEYFGNPDKFFYSIMKNNVRIYGIANLASDIKPDEFDSLKLAIKRLKKEEIISDNGIPTLIIEKLLSGAKIALNDVLTNNVVKTEEKEKPQDFKDAIMANMLEAKEPYNGDKYSFKPTKAQSDYFERNLKTKQQQKKEEIKQEVKEEVNIHEEVAKLVTDENLEQTEAQITTNEVNNIYANVIDENINRQEDNNNDNDDEDIIIKITPEELPSEEDFESELAATFERVVEDSLNKEESAPEDVFIPSDFVLTKAEEISLDNTDINTKENDDSNEEKTFLDVNSMLDDEDE